MKESNIDRIKYLCAKERLAKDKLITFSVEEKKELEGYKEKFDKLPKTFSKTIMYMHDFLGIEFLTISELINYSYEYVRHEYYNIKNVFMTM